MKKYYTPNNVADLMVSLVSEKITPNRVVDICAGSWQLLLAARRRWVNMNLVGIDIDPKASPLNQKKVEFICKDGRDFALECLTLDEKFSLVLANPPFGSSDINWKPKFATLPGYKCMSGKARVRIETSMILANLAILDNNGMLVTIVPKTVVEGDLFSCLRTYLIQNFKIKSIINLPSNVFGSDISTCILIIENCKDLNDKIQIYQAKQFDNRYILKEEPFLTKNKFLNGLQTLVIKRETKNIEVKRGSISNELIKKEGYTPVIHSTDILKMKLGDWKPTRFAIPKLKLSSNPVYARYGDILIIRVGRNCGIVTRYELNLELPISDCLFIIKPINLEQSDILWRIINSRVFQKRVNSIKKGITTKYLSLNQYKIILNQYYEDNGWCINDNYKTKSSCL